MNWRLGPAYGLAATLARAGGGPRVCLVGTAVGDSSEWLLAMYAAFGRAGWRVSHLALFPEPNVADITEHLLAQDVVWVAGGTTDSFGLPLRPVTNGLGFLPYSNSPHHDAEEQRRPTIHRLIGEGILPDGYTSDNGTGLIFEGTELVDCVSEVDGARTWHLTRRPDGTVDEVALATRLL